MLNDSCSPPTEQKNASLFCPEGSCSWTSKDDPATNTAHKTDSMTDLEMLKTHLFYKHGGEKNQAGAELCQAQTSGPAETVLSSWIKM